MEIDRPFIRLPFAFDADRLAQEVKALSDDTWMDHPLGLRGNFAIPLISREGSDNDDFHGRMCVTPHLEACLYLQQVMASFGEVLGRSRLMKLAPGCDESVHMRPGECWIFNSWCRHRVVNAGMQERIHLVIDASGSSRFWRIVRRIQQMDPHTDAAAVDALVERVFFDPQKQVRVLTEQFNIAPVMSPGEVDALVADLVRDFSQSASNDCHRVTHYANVLSDFARDWREIWHQYGYGRDGWPAYRATIAAVHGQLHPDPGALVTQNGVGVNRIIVQRILKPALATDQFDRFTSS
jgi:hypothetical protein